MVITLGGAAPDNLTFQEAQYLNGNQGLVTKAVQDAIRNVLRQKSPSHYVRIVAQPDTSEPVETRPVSIVRGLPKIGEEFELYLDGDAVANEPLEMVRRDGHSLPSTWQHIGVRVAGRQTRRFMILDVGYCRNLNQVRKKITVDSDIPEGQWREAFKTKFPGGYGRPVGIADPSWIQQPASVFFPYVDSEGRSDFFSVRSIYIDRLLWLVKVRQ